MAQQTSATQAHTPQSSTNLLQELRAVLALEGGAILHAASGLPDTLSDLCQRVATCKGRIVFSGIGKSGHIARKLSATFSSLGMPALFLHPAEALHGDLGMVAAGDICIILSKSGTGSELKTLIPHLQSAGAYCALLCCRSGELTTVVDTHVLLPFSQEACPHNLAPTASSTLMLAVGDALAIVASKLRGFSQDDFGRMHPSGALGKSLLLEVASFMHAGDELPLLEPTTSFPELLVTITQKKKGVGIVAQEGKLLGVVTDGDLRRACEEGASVFEHTAQQIMSPSPITVTPDMAAFDALQLMEEKEITSLVVARDNHVVGLVHIHDLIKAGIKR